MTLSALDLMALLNVRGVGAATVRRILSLQSQMAGLSSNGDIVDSTLSSVLRPAQLDELSQARTKAEREWVELKELGVTVLAITDPKYPEGLKTALGEESPLLLLCRGNLSLFQANSVGFCGSRSATDKGMSAAWDSAFTLASARVNVVSGYAAGVDLRAHTAALSNGGTTTVVLAEGLLRFRVKREIRSVWDEERTLVVSEFGANGAWSVGNAMQRNKTICALSRALILVEARETGGSIAAGRECLRLGLPLFAAVYEGSPEQSRGNEAVLGIGARPLMKSRATNLPNIQPVLNAVLNPQVH